ncbi:MAG: hypothetical protein JO362_20240 [Streptomycetaceae bacterium]|nr:hypothetical protein [Streptomycetaceae bacterium]
MNLTRYLLSRLRQWPAHQAARFDYVRQAPRSFLLARAHVCGPSWVYVLAAVGAWACVYVLPTGWAVLLAAVVIPGFVLDSVAFGAHAAWSAGLAWQETACPCCDYPAGGWSDDVAKGPDGPEDHGLTPADLQFLDMISLGLVPSGPTSQEMP